MILVPVQGRSTLEKGGGWSTLLKAHKSLRKTVDFASYGLIGELQRTVLESESRVKSRF